MVTGHKCRNFLSEKRRKGYCVGDSMKKIRQFVSLKMKIAVVLSVFTIFVFVVMNTGIISAIWDSNQAVHVNASDIENSTLIIGTHLIHLSALTDELYEIAYQSAADSGQMTMFYKSELANGAWINLGSASNVMDLTGSSNKAVSDDKINELYFEYHTKSDGVTYDLRTNIAICVYDILNPYDLESMKELEPLKNHYQNIQEQLNNNNNSLEKIGDKIKDFFSNEVEDEYTAERDREIEELNRYLQILVSNNGSDNVKEVVNKIMSKVDSARRVHVFNGVRELLYKLEEDLNSSDDEESPSLTDTLTALYSSIENIEESYREHDGNMLKEGNTILSKAEYDEAMNLIQHALEGLDSECDIDADHLSVIYNVNDNVIVNRSAEYLYLTEELMKRGETAFENVLAAGINDEYKKELNKKSSRVVLNSIVSENKSKIAGIKGELEFIIQAVIDRSDSGVVTDFLMDKLNGTGNYKSVIPADAFQESALAEVEDYRQWLENKIKESGADAVAGGNELSSLYEEQQELQEKKMEALDKNDLDEANRMDALITANSEKIEELEEKLSEEINTLTEQAAELQKKSDALNREDGSGDGNGNDAEKRILEQQIAELKAKLAAVTAGMADGSRVSAIAGLKKSAMDSIAEVKASGSSAGGSGNGEVISEAVAAIGQTLDGLTVFLDTNTKQVYNALQELYSSLIAEKYLNELNDYDELIQRIEQLISANADLFSGLKENNSILSSAELEDIMNEMRDNLLEGESLLDNGTVDLSSMRQEEINSAILAGLAQYGEFAEEGEIDGLLAVQAKKELNSGNERVFETVSGTAGVEYVSVKALAQASGYRYIWNDSFKTATLALGTKYYAFTAFSDRVVRSSDAESFDILSHANEFQGIVYVDDDYAFREFGYEAYYLGNTGYGVLVNDEILELAAEICDIMLDIEK